MHAGGEDLAEILGDKGANLLRLLVVRVVVAGRQHVGAEEDTARDFGAEAAGACRLVQLAQSIGGHAQSEPHAVKPGEIGRRLGRRDDIVDRNGEIRVRERHVAHFGPARAEGIKRVVAALRDAQIERLRKIFARATDDHTLEIVGPRRTIAIHGTVGAGRIERIAAGDDLERGGCVVHRRAEYAHLVERRREGNEPEPADASIRRLHTDDAAV